MSIEIKNIKNDTALQLAPLIAAFAQEQNRGAPRRPDKFYAEQLLADPSTKILGGFLKNELVGFCVYFDLPDMITGMRTGQLDEIFVNQSARGHGVGTAMINALIEEGKQSNWIDLRIVLTATNHATATFFEKFTSQEKLNCFVVQIDDLIRRG